MCRRAGDAAVRPVAVAGDIIFQTGLTGGTGESGGYGVAVILLDAALCTVDFGGDFGRGAGERTGDFGDHAVAVAEQCNAVVVLDLEVRHRGHFTGNGFRYTEHPVNHVDRMGTVIRENIAVVVFLCVPCVFEIVPCVGRKTVTAAVVTNLAQRALLHHLAHLLVLRVGAALPAHGELHAVAVDRVYNSVGFAQMQRHRLVQDDVLLRVGCLFCVLRVVAGLAADAYRRNVALQQLFQRVKLLGLQRLAAAFAAWAAS